MHQRLVNFISVLEKVFLFFIAFAIVIFVVVQLRVATEDLGRIFFLTGKMEDYIILAGFLYFITYIFRKLLVWEFRELRGKRGKRKKRGRRR